MEPYLKITAFSPAWIRDFKCSGQDCPLTCCRGWNIPVDEAHAAFYSQVTDPDLAPRLQISLKEIRTKRNRQYQNHYFLNLLDQPEEICALQDSEGLCRIQKEFGAAALPDTCYFFPKVLWQINNGWTLSADFACPEVLRAAILSPEPATFQWIETERDPQAEWLETTLIQDQPVRALLTNRQAIVLAVIRIIQDRRFETADRVYRACRFLSALTMENLPEDADKAVSQIEQAASATINSAADEEKIKPFVSSEKAAVWVRQLDKIFNWGMESNGKFNREMQHDFLQLLCGRTDPFMKIAENYLLARDHIFLPYISANPHLIENFFVHFVFSDMLKQFSAYQTGYLTVDEILGYEISQLCAVFALFHFLMAGQTLTAGHMNRQSFLQTIYHAGQSYLHYPAFIRQCVRRLPPGLSREEDIRLLLSC